MKKKSVVTCKSSSSLALSRVLGQIITLDEKRKSLNAMGVNFVDYHSWRIV